MGKALVLALLAFPLIAEGVRAQRSDVVFDDTVLPVVSISLDPADLALILAPGNERSDVEYLASFQWSSPLLDATVDSVGFRLRGNTSRVSQKKSFKVSFNAFTSGGWRGLDKLNLNGEHNDPTIMRSKMAWDLFRDFGVPASRANHVELYVNDVYFGLYVNVEHVDEEFLDRYFETESGNLYKALWPADLARVGPTGDSYRPTSGDRRPYDLTQGASDAEGYDDLATLINVINSTSNSGFGGAIERVFNVNGFLKALAVTALTGSWDTYWFLKNNFYLYNNPRTGRWDYIPFDMDNSFGIWWDGIWPGLNWNNRDIYAWGHPSEDRPLTRRIMAVPEFRERYTYYIRELLDDLFVPSRLEAEIGRLKAMTEGAAEADQFRVLDYGFSTQDYHDSFLLALANRDPQRQGHVKSGLSPYISERFSSALGQLDSGGIAPLISDVRLSLERPRPTDPLGVTARVESRSLSLIEVEYWPDRPGRFTVEMTRVAGSAANDPIDAFFEATVPPLGGVGTLDLRIHAVGENGMERETSLLRIGVDWSAPPLYINEIMAQNASTLSDEFGEFADWVELYNGGDVSQDLSGMTLTDDPLVPAKWTLPDVLMPAGSHLLLWLDGQPEQGQFHGPFRLSSDGESVSLFEVTGLQVDAVSFGAQSTDLSWARLGDGLPGFAQSQPTPGTPNPLVGTDSSPLPKRPALITAYPNPFRGSLTISAPGPVDVFDVLGRRVYHSKESQRRVWDASAFPAGLYFVRMLGPDGGVIASLPVLRLK